MKIGQKPKQKRKTNNAGRMAPSVLTPAQREAREGLTEASPPVPRWMEDIQAELSEISASLAWALTQVESNIEHVGELCGDVARRVATLAGPLESRHVVSPLPYKARKPMSSED
jgi:hypothetical protein